MRKKPDNLKQVLAAVTEEEASLIGTAIFQIRIAEDPQGIMWAATLLEDFREMCMGHDLEWRRRMAERILYMAEESIMEGLGVKPQ